MVYDFGGYATKYNVKCADGRVIRKGSFDDMNGQEVPIVWQHQRNDPENILGKAMLEVRDDGVYAYGNFNSNRKAVATKNLLEHGDVNSLSIFANQLVQRGNNVMHGAIREVSVVVAGANPLAKIDNLQIEHSDDEFDDEIIEDEAIISGFAHSIDMAVPYEEDENKEDSSMANGIEHAEQATGQTMREIFNSMTDQQKQFVYAIVGAALSSQQEDAEQDAYDDDDDYIQHEEDGPMKRNIFEGDDSAETNALSHADIDSIFESAKRIGSLKNAVNDFALEHSIVGVDETGKANGIFPDDILFPEAKAMSPTPDMIMRQQDWVSKVWNATKKSPFSRIKSVTADITADEARAKGYQKGKKKMEEVITLLKRSTTPQTVYKLQKMDRDDIIDITSFDVVAWIKAEMRLMLNEELSRAILIGDGRQAGAEDKINESNIRSVWRDDDLYTIKYKVQYSPEATDDDKADAIVTAVHRARKDYRGSGSPTFYTDTDTITTLLLAKDKIGRRLYPTMAELTNALRVREIVEVPVMENAVREGSGDKGIKLIGLIVNLTDYTIGADRGGAVSMFDDFDIDYNKYTYLIETRCSGALTKPYSAIALEVDMDAQPMYLNIDPMGPTEEVYGKKVSDLQSDVSVGTTFITGTLNYTPNYTKFSSNADEQSGHYVALRIGVGPEHKIPEGHKVTISVDDGRVKEKELTSGDNYLVLRMDRRSGNYLHVTLKKDAAIIDERVLSLSELRFEGGSRH